jgi:uncharacterized membrane protein YgdD (TMEM256/DUF423 family)
MRFLLAAAALCGFALVGMGAVGAHMVAAGAIDGGRWNSAMLYGFVHTLAVVLALSVPLRSVARITAAGAFLAGVLFFSGVQIARLGWSGLNDGSTLTPFDALSPLVPVGGLAFMAGWIALGVAALIGKRERDA